MRDKALDVSCCVSGDISAPVCSDRNIQEVETKNPAEARFFAFLPDRLNAEAKTS